MIDWGAIAGWLMIGLFILACLLAVVALLVLFSMEADNERERLAWRKKNDL